MDGRTNSTKSYAEEGLESITSVASEAEANVGANTTGQNEDEFVQVGGLEPIAYFLRFTAPKKTTKNPYKIWEKGQTFIGTYIRSFTSGKFNNPTYIIRLDDGTCVGLPSPGSLKKGMDRVAEGGRVKVTYDGTQPIKGGQFEGTDAHLFTVFTNRSK